ncbi:MAG: ATP-binding cassette domain-containing protein, partial [Candidatus Cloacimonadaceae bacterium]|nr:ATP-binding cassette domain-containing protein [Candidatus Cloacimonadaceae bacterium]
DLPLGRGFKKIHYEEARAALHETGMSRHEKDLIGALSGGEFQRVLLSRALVTKSRYLVLDEPEASIDRPGVESFFAILQKIHSSGKTVITISHDLNTLNKYCTFLICLNQRLHCHDHLELVNAETVQNTFGETLRIVEKDY